MANQALTGIWSADDGGVYYVHQIDSAVWWAGFSNDHGLQNGLTFCNIFNGILKGNEVSGQWADVPRGGTMNYGTLSVVPTFKANGSPVSFVAINQTGGFSATTWNFRSLALPPNLYQPLQEVFNNTYKNTYHDTLKLEYLGQLLEILKDSMVFYGTLQTGRNLPQDPFTNTFPHTWPRTYSAFRDMNHWYDADLTQWDADLTCHITPDLGYLPNDLYVGLSPAQQSQVAEKLRVDLHPEMIMFAGSNNTNEPSQLLPGWAQTGANSVLVNGRPLNANVVITKPATSPQIADIKPAVGDYVRVTGAMVLDVDHNPPPFELHPVYAIDFINASSTHDISGVWGDRNGNTFYIHNVFGTIWMLITRPFRDRTFAVVFRGNLVGNTARGDWVAIPYGTATSFGNDMSLVIGSSALDLSIAGHNPWSPEDLKKLYDAPGHPCPLISVSIELVNHTPCDFPEVEGATVVYSVTLSPFVHDPFITYAWTTTGGVPGSSSQATFQVSDLPAAGTEVTVSVEVTLNGTCVYLGTRTFTAFSQLRAEQLQHLCQSLRRAEKGIQQIINQAVRNQDAHKEQIIEEAHHEILELDRALAEMKRNLKH